MYRILHIPTGLFVRASFTNEDTVISRGIGSTPYDNPRIIEVFTENQYRALWANLKHDTIKRVSVPIFAIAEEVDSYYMLSNVKELLVMEV